MKYPRHSWGILICLTRTILLSMRFESLRTWESAIVVRARNLLKTRKGYLMMGESASVYEIINIAHSLSLNVEDR